MLFTARRQKIVQIVLLFMCVIVVSAVSGWYSAVLMNEISHTAMQTPHAVILQDRSRSQQLAPPSLQDVLSSIAPSIFEIYSDQKTEETTVNGVRVFLPVQSNFIGYGLAVTADGWLITSAEMQHVYPANIRIRDYTGAVHAIDQIQNDNQANMAYLHFSGVNIKPIQFLKGLDTTNPITSYRVIDTETIAPIITGEPFYERASSENAYTHVSNVLDKKLNANTTFEKLCEPIMKDQYTVIGCTRAKGIVPFSNIQRSLNNLLKYATIPTPALSLSYIDLAQVPGLQQSQGAAHRGALIEKKQTILQHGSVIDVLMPGDIITDVNDEHIDENRNLSDLLAEYSIGDAITLHVSSQGQVKSISFLLY